jgi:hypothetical protein
MQTLNVLNTTEHTNRTAAFPRNLEVLCCVRFDEVSGSSSAVERQLPKLDVAGSIPVSRSIIQPTSESGFQATIQRVQDEEKRIVSLGSRQAQHNPRR